MSMKEFDAKRFLLEKGERVGLGVAVSLMVLMLIWSLFRPEKGFFSGSPGTKAKDLNDMTAKLDNALRTRQPGDNDKPPPREGRMIAFDNNFLKPDQYGTSPFFEPSMKENPNRRPPKIYPVEEAIAEVVSVPIDSYLFDKNFEKIWVLVDKESGKRSSSGGGNAGFNPFNALKGAGSQGGGGMMQQMQQQMQQQMRQQQGGGGQMQMQMQMQQMQMQRLQNPAGNAISQLGGGSGQEYQVRQIPFADWNPQELTAHQPRPLRMVIIAGSFPYRNQLEEHKRRLRKSSIQDVLNEQVDLPDGKNKAQSFRFVGAEVERVEVDANGNKLNEWFRLPLAETYKVWVQYTWYPFEDDDQKILPVRFPGLAMPLLREFDAGKASTPGVPGMNQMMMMMQGQMQPGATQPKASAEGAADSHKLRKAMDGVLAKLPNLQATLEKLNGVKAQQIAAPKPNRQVGLFDPFNPNENLSGGNAAQPTAPPPNAQGGATGGEDFIPDYALVRAVDVNIEPGKRYRYRIRIKMANPNYKRDDVASPEYKEKVELESKEWYELPQTVSVPPESYFYVVDEKHGKSTRDMRAIPPDSAQSQLWNQNAAPDQVVMQFHRWVETTQKNRKHPDDIVPVGEWAVADRVPVARGEYIGRQVKVDIPIWIYTRNALILPSEETKRTIRRPKTGIYVDFGQDPPENNLILVDFEGGRVSVPGTQAGKSIDDNTALEVLMLSPDGKLLARSSVKDTNDDERKQRREEVLKRIQEVREGKKE